MKTLISTILSAALVAGLYTTADAGRGSSTAKIRRAIQSDVPSAIASELERAEYLWCGSCIEDVMALLDHPEYTVREVAAWWFARRPAQKREIAERATAYLQGDNSVLARNAADALGTFRDPAAIPVLSQAALRADLDADARMAAVRALGTIGHRDANPALADAMADTDAVVRAEAVRAWRAIRGQADATPVVALIDDADVVVRREAAAVVGQFSEASARTALEAVLASDPDPATRRNAAWALGQIGDAASRSALEAATEDSSGLVRGVARAALSQLR